MSDYMVLLPILIPIIGGIAVCLMPNKAAVAQNIIAVLASALALAASILLFHKDLFLSLAWVGLGIDFVLSVNNFSSMIVLVTASAFLTILFSTAFMKDHPNRRYLLGLILLIAGFASGAMLANNLVLMLFFWEGLLGFLYVLIMTGGPEAQPAARKALVLNGLADLCMIFGIALTAWLANTMNMDEINLPLDSFWAVMAYLMMMVGAVTKGGSMPFHTWIPDTASVAPLPVMAFIAAALDKILGIYLVARMNLELFQLEEGSALSHVMMTLGCCTIILMVMMALIQKDYKKLLSYHAISQVGYMILGIGSGVPAGIVGGLFHMVNNAIYKSCLFFTAGAVEQQTGTTDLHKLGGLSKRMPLTCACFIVAALSIAGVPPLNGFFSKELVFDAALEGGIGYFIVAALGAFCTAASFLKLGHTVYFGKLSQAAKQAKEVSWPMLVPAMVLAALCVLFGVINPIPLEGMIEPILGERLHHTLSGLPHSWWLSAISGCVLLAAYANHRFGVARTGHPLKAVDHIHHAPGLINIYDLAETGFFDIYRIGGYITEALSLTMTAVDRVVDWLYTGLAAGLAGLLSRGINRAHTGSPWLYVLWVLAGAAVVAIMVFTVGG